MDHGALHDALKTRRRFRFRCPFISNVLEFPVDEIRDVHRQLLEIDTTGFQDRNRILIFGERQQQMFKGRVFMLSFGRQGERTMQSLFEVS